MHKRIYNCVINPCFEKTVLFSDNIKTNEANIGANTNKIATNTASIANNDIDIKSNSAYITDNGADIDWKDDDGQYVYSD